MKIDINQTVVEMKNEFEIIYDNNKQYTAILPFLNIRGVFDLDKLREIKVLNLNNEEVFKTEYNYLDNQLEEAIPLKYLITKSQKFNQVTIINNNGNEECKIYFEMNAILNGSYIIKKDNKYYKGYTISDGYITHIAIYDEETQIGELLKPQIIFDEKDTYRIYLKDEYNYLKNSLSLLALYLDRTCYNSSYLKNKSQTITYSKSYSKTNKYYNPNWVKENFDSKEYFDRIDKQIIEVKNNIKNQFKKILKIFAIAWIAIILLVIILLTILL